MKNKIFTLCILTILLFVNFCSCSEKISAEAVPTLKVGDNHQIIYNAPHKNILFESSNDKIATVDNQGMIKALAPGEIEIRIFPNDANKASSQTGKIINVKVIQPVKSIDCKHALTVAIGNVENINAKVLPENSSIKTLIYKSSDEAVATVDDKGNVTGMKKGQAIITATSPDGVSENCQVSIKQPVTSITLNKQSMNLSVNGTSTINAVLNPKDADYNTKLTFSSSDNSIITIDKNGKIKAISAGKATITVVAHDKDGKSLTANCEITVNPPASSANNASSKTSDYSSSKTSPPKIEIPPLELPCSGCMGSGRLKHSNLSTIPKRGRTKSGPLKAG